MRCCAKIRPGLMRRWTSTAARFTANKCPALPASPNARRRKSRVGRSTWLPPAKQQPVIDGRVYLRRAHVGYYLIDRGFEELKAQIGYHPRSSTAFALLCAATPMISIIGGIEVLTVTLIAAVLLPLIPNYSIFGGLTVRLPLLLIPATQGAVDLDQQHHLFRLSSAASAEDRPHRRHPCRLHHDGGGPDAAAEREPDPRTGPGTRSPLPRQSGSQSALRAAHRSARLREPPPRERHRSAGRSGGAPDQRAERPLQGSKEVRPLPAAASAAHLQRAPGRVDGLGAQARQAARPEQPAHRPLRRLPGEGRRHQRAAQSALHHHARFRHAAAARHRARHGRAR